MKAAFLLVFVITGSVLTHGEASAQSNNKGPFDFKAKVSAFETQNAPRAALSLAPSVQTLAQSIADLEATVTSLKKEVTVLKAELKKTNSSLEMMKSASTAPAGYTTTWMSKAFLDRQKGPEFLRIHVQVPTK